MEKNLIEKLADKWADVKHAVKQSKIAKRVATIMLAGAMVVPVALSASACTVTENSDGTYTVDPNGDPNENNSNSGNNSNPGGSGDHAEPAPGGNSSSKPELNYDEFSPLLQRVLKSSKWDELMRKAESGELLTQPHHFDWTVNLLEAVPYSFLEREGEDIDAIKRNDVAASPHLFTLENDKNHIYNLLRLQYYVDGGKENIYKKYFLKYEISQQELNDFKMLLDGNYYQYFLMFQQLDSERTPEVLATYSATRGYDESIMYAGNTKGFFWRDSFDGAKINDAIITDISPTTLFNDLAYNMKFYLFSYEGENSTNTIYEIDAQEANTEIENGVLHLLPSSVHVGPLNDKLISTTKIKDHFYNSISTSTTSFKALF